MLSLNKSYKNRKLSRTIHCKYKYLDSTVQRAEDRRQKFYFCRLPFAVNVKLNLTNNITEFEENIKLRTACIAGRCRSNADKVSLIVKKSNKKGKAVSM